jgi:hypothetical protein
MKFYVIVLFVVSDAVQFSLTSLTVKLFPVCTLEPPFKVYLGDKLFVTYTEKNQMELLLWFWKCFIHSYFKCS